MQFQNLLDEEIIQYRDKLEADLAKLLQTKNLKVAVAESLTGGLISNRLIKRPGSSNYFLGSVVCYDTLMKIKLCGVLPQTVRKHSVVSKEVALEMLKGIKKLTNCDIGISATGAAGPPNDEFGVEMIGRVFIGLLGPDKENVKEFKFTGTREIIIANTADAALTLLRNYLRRD